MPPRRILLVRNDRLGDFLLAWPAFALLRKALPETEIEALVPSYTAEMASLCPSLDRVRLEPGVSERGLIREWRRLGRALRGTDAEWALVFATRLPLALALWRSGIPERLAPATKIDQIFYNHRLRQRRSHSVQPEWRYNVDLARHALALWGCPAPALPGPPYLRLDEEEVREARSAFVTRERLDPGTRLVFLHPGHRGSARNLGPEAYARLGSALLEDPALTLVVTAGPGEETLARQVLSSLHPEQRARLYVSREGIGRFALHVAFADLWISGSTGPLHLAGALNRPTFAFYPTRRSTRSVRWQTLNEDCRRLALEFAEDETEGMLVERALELIRAYLRSGSVPGARVRRT